MISAKGKKECISLSEKYKGSHKFTSNGIVYVVAYSDGLVKVGRTRNFKQRLAGIINGRQVKDCFCMLTLNYGNVETKSHSLLSNYAVGGEYFSCTYNYAIAIVSSLFESPVFITKSERSELDKKSRDKCDLIINRISSPKIESNKSELTSEASEAMLLLYNEFSLVTKKIKSDIEEKINKSSNLSLDDLSRSDDSVLSLKINWSKREEESMKYLMERQSYLEGRIKSYEDIFMSK